MSLSVQKTLQNGSNVPTNSLLKKHFMYLINSRQLTFKLGRDKILHMLKEDLGINLQHFSRILVDVCVDAFDYYVHEWSGWQRHLFQQCVDNPTDAYKQFRIYLKQKLLHLRDKETDFLENAKNEYFEENNVNINIYTNRNEGIVVSPPVDPSKDILQAELPQKRKLPFTLQINGRPNFYNYMCFQYANGKTTFCFQMNSSDFQLSSRAALNHPFVIWQFKIPMMIKLSHKNSHKIEMFLCQPNDKWSFPKIEHVNDIRKFPTRSNVYSWGFMKSFLSKLILAVLSYKAKITSGKTREIRCVLDQFLCDIAETNLNKCSVQECTEVTFNIGESVYYSDSAENCNAIINCRKIITPQVMYSLVYCSLVQDSINSDGSFKCFEFIKKEKTSNSGTAPNNELSIAEKAFIKDINASLTYSCTMCNLHYDQLETIKDHLRHVHPCQELLKCIICNKESHICELLTNRWKHNCTNQVVQ